MAVDVEALSTTDFLALLRYEGKPPPGAEYDNIRMTPQEWAELFPGAVQHEEPTDEPTAPTEGGEVDAEHPEPAAAPV
jgi:hypothetical protein